MPGEKEETLAYKFRKDPIHRDEMDKIGITLSGRWRREKNSKAVLILAGLLFVIGSATVALGAGLITYGWVMQQIGQAAAAAKAAKLVSLFTFLSELGILVGIWGKAGKKD